MANTGYQIKVAVPAAREKVFAAICDIPAWWTKDYSGYNSQVNDEFIIHHPGQHYSKQRVAELIPGQKIVWEVIASELNWLMGNKAEWTGTRMIFELSDHEISFRHEGLAPDKECYQRCCEGWDFVIKEKLLNYLTIWQQ